MTCTSHRRPVSLLLVVAFYIMAIAFTNAHFMADSAGYVVSILAYEGVSEYVAENPVVRDFRSENPFWDFGHLLWRPVGLVLLKVFSPLSQLAVGIDPAHNLFFLFMSLNFAAGLLCCVLLYCLMERLTDRRWVVVLVTIGFVLSNGFLNFTQTGSPYIIGLAFLLSGLYLLLRRKGDVSLRTSALAGLLFAVSVTMWTLYGLVVPSIIAAPLVLFGASRRVTRAVMFSAATFILVTAVTYGLVMFNIGVHSPGDLRDWIAASSHGVHTSGASRMLFGLPRSFIHMGNDGVLFKRFLLHDPFNPVSAIDLMRASLWKLGLFYLALASTFVALVVSSARRVLILFLINAVPVICFAVLFDGGAVERYLPLYPIMFLSFAYTIGSLRVPRVLKVLPVMFFAVAALANVGEMARPALAHKQQRTVERLEGVVSRLRPHSWIVTTHLQDEIVNFQGSSPFHPLNKHNTYRIYPLVNVNSAQATEWRQQFLSHVLDTWSKDGDVWLSTRLRSPRPQPDWNWVEGDDPNVSWTDIYNFFAALQMGALAGGSDGFVLLDRSNVNEELFKDYDS